MDQALTQIIITALAGTVATLATVIFKMQNDKIAKLEEQEAKRQALQEATTKTLQAVVDVGMERLRAQQPPEPPR